MRSHLLLVVAESYRLTGLGLLAISHQPESLLRQFTLHTKLEVQLAFPDGGQQTVSASVEEMTKSAEPGKPHAAPGETTTAVLLLESEIVTDLPPGTQITWLGDTSSL